MRRIGILGGCSPESTVEYYRHLTRGYAERFGDHAYPEIVVYSVSFQRFIDWMRAGDWASLAAGIVEGLRSLDAAGAEAGVIASNTFHRVFDEVSGAMRGTPLRMISLLDVVAERLADLGCRRAGLLGTGITMAEAFYPDRFAREGIETAVPDEEDRRVVDRIIFEELSRGRVTEAARARVLEISGRLIEAGADGLILGCTELPQLIQEGDFPVPILDTTALHAAAALDGAIASKPSS